MEKSTTVYILPTSVNLLGFCLGTITALHLNDRIMKKLTDEFTSLIALMLAFSALYSYLSIKSTKMHRVQRLEKIADILFLISLIGIVILLFYLGWNVKDMK